MYEIRKKGLILGHSLLESGDAPMGVALGAFWPAEKFSDFKQAEQAMEDGNQRRWLDCSLYNQHRVQVDEASVVIIEIGESDAPFSLTVTCFLPYPKYEEMFPHHVEAYRSAF